jgi:hypothetical protein
MDPLKESLLNLGYQCEEIADKVFLIENFLKSEEAFSINDVINSSSEKDWSTHYMEGVLGLAERKYGRSDIKNLLDEGLIEITSHWIDKNLLLPFEISDPISRRIREVFEFSDQLSFDGVGTIQRQYSGAPLIEHVDNHSDPLIEYAVIIYVNDDYVDGELFFSKLNLSIRPKKYSMIIFPSGEKYIHGVKPPGDGPLRYVLPSFVKRNEEYETG